MENNNFSKYHESVSAELLASQNRVRYFIENRHWGEDGRFKEVLLMNYLKKVLPSNVSVGTGFIRNGTETTSQIDLIIYDNTYPTLFSEGDFVIALSESVYGIIEVKSKVVAGEECISTIKKANDNGVIIDKEIFNGIFSYETEINFSYNRPLANSIKNALENNYGYINHISLGSDIFIKYWSEGNPEDNDEVRSFSFYKIEKLSFGYFISNLIETIYRKSRMDDLDSGLRDFLYPIEQGKETMRLRNLEVKFNVSIP